MNELIESIFAGWTVNGVQIPVKFLRYNGHGEPYVTYQQQDMDASLNGDDSLLGYADYYDFDVYSRGNYMAIIDDLIVKLEQNGFKWIVSRSSGDMYEDDTGYYHKTLNFGILRGYENG